MNRLFALLVALPLFLQAQHKGDLEVGVGGGLNVATGYGSDADGLDHRISFQAGVTGEYYLNDRWGVKSGVIYDSKGTEGDFTISGVEVADAEIQLEYLFIPFYANWHFGKDRNWYLNFGPYLDILLAAEEGSLNVDIKDDLSPVDIGLGAGVGYKYYVANKAAIFLEYQGAAGFIKVPENDAIEDNNNSIFNIRSALNLGMVFTL